jgi:hypothetical protein
MENKNHWEFVNNSEFVPKVFLGSKGKKRDAFDKKLYWF